MLDDRDRLNARRAQREGRRWSLELPGARLSVVPASAVWGVPWIFRAEIDNGATHRSKFFEDLWSAESYLFGG